MCSYTDFARSAGQDLQQQGSIGAMSHADICVPLHLQILDGCPWVLPRLVFVLACRSTSLDFQEDVRSMYSLRTKVKQEGAADALAKVGQAYSLECMDVISCAIHVRYHDE